MSACCEDRRGSGEEPRSSDRDLPAYRTADMNVPILLVQGDRDPVVDPEHAYRMRAMLEANGKPYEWMLLEDATHDPNPKQWVQLMSRVFEFLGQHPQTGSGSGSEPVANVKHVRHPTIRPENVGSGLSRYSTRAQLRDLRGAAAELGEDLVGVLAVCGRHRARRPRRPAEVDRRRGELGGGFRRRARRRSRPPRAPAGRPSPRRSFCTGAHQRSLLGVEDLSPVVARTRREDRDRARRSARRRSRRGPAASRSADRRSIPGGRPRARAAASGARPRARRSRTTCRRGRSSCSRTGCPSSRGSPTPMPTPKRTATERSKLIV